MFLDLCPLVPLVMWVLCILFGHLSDSFTFQVDSTHIWLWFSSSSSGFFNKVRFKIYTHDFLAYLSTLSKITFDLPTLFFNYIYQSMFRKKSPKFGTNETFIFLFSFVLLCLVFILFYLGYCAIILIRFIFNMS